MSTGLECEFIEYEPGRWYYILQNWDCPRMCWDWHEYATAYGPFTTEEEADQHLRDTQPNPGGSSTQAYDEIHAARRNAVLVDLIKHAAR